MAVLLPSCEMCLPSGAFSALLCTQLKNAHFGKGEGPMKLLDESESLQDAALETYSLTYKPCGFMSRASQLVL